MKYYVFFTNTSPVFTLSSSVFIAFIAKYLINWIISSYSRAVAAHYPWKTWIASLGTSNSFKSFDAVLLKPKGPHTSTKGEVPKDATGRARISRLILPLSPLHSPCSESTCSTLTCGSFSISSLQGMSLSFLLKKSSFAGWLEVGR